MSKRDKNFCPDRAYMLVGFNYFVVTQTLNSGPSIFYLSLGPTHKEFRTEGFRLNNHSLNSKGPVICYVLEPLSASERRIAGINSPILETTN